MGLADEYPLEDVGSGGTDAYREAVQSGAREMGLSDAYRMWRETGCSTILKSGIDGVYTAAADLVTGLDYAMEAVESFCASTDLDGMDGLFVSAAVKEAPGDRARLPDLSRVDQVGYRTGKTVHVEGDVGDRCGEELMGGSIHVEGRAGTRTGAGMRHGAIVIAGDVDAYCGEGMVGGSITVQGDATGEDGDQFYKSSYLGYRMEGGRITVHGHGGSRIGTGMRDGTIDIHGDAGSHIGSTMQDGSITVRGTVTHNVGEVLYGGTVRVGRTSYTVGRGMEGGTIIVDEQGGAGWPALPSSATGGTIRFGTGEEDQVWPSAGEAEPYGEVV